MDIKKILFRTNSIDVEHALPDAIIMTNKDGKIQWVNDIASEIFETSKMHLLTSNIQDFIENATNLIVNSIEMHKPVITKNSSREVYYDMTAREIDDGYVLDFRDAISDTNNDSQIYNTNYEHVNRGKNNFLLKLSHDLKSPVQSIVGFSQAISDGLGGQINEQQEKYIKIIKKNSSDLMYFIGKLLELSETEIGKNNIEKHPLDVSALINSVVKFNEQLYKGKDVKINLKQDDNYKKTVTTNSDILKNIVQDLLEVILKCVETGEVSICLSIPDEYTIKKKDLPANGQYTMISISSTAMLLSESDLECMFDPYRIIDSPNRKNVLRAIVLASVKNMVQALNGIIWVESQILKNTSFNVIIPD